MKRVQNIVEPRFKDKAKLIDNYGKEIEVPCKVWIPRHINENPYFKFESSKDGNKSLVSPGIIYQLKMELFGFGGEKSIEITVEELYIENYTLSHTSGDLPPLLSFESEPQFVVVKQFIHQEQGQGDTTITFRLGENFLLEPAKIIERSYTGEVKIKDVAHQEGEIENIGKVTFDRHYYYIDQKDGGNVQYSNLVGIVTPTKSIEPTISNIDRIKIEIKDYLLLSSFASNQRTNIVGFSTMHGNCLIDAYYGHLITEKKSDTKKHSHHDVLIDKASFKDFIESAASTFTRYGLNEKELLRQAIYKILPVDERTIETSILNLFSALETIVLIYRRNNNYEFTVPISSKWKKLEKQMKTVIKDLDVFPSEEHRKMLIRMIPSLKRVPLKDAYNSFVVENTIDMGDLWPVFGPTKGYSLNDIRNHLSHGDSFDSELIGPLCNAMDNLEVLVKRLILSCLSWDISKSNVSRNTLERWGWIPNKSIEKDMIDIENITKASTRKK